jgi:hypothetical protein
MLSSVLLTTFSRAWLWLCLPPLPSAVAVYEVTFPSPFPLHCSPTSPRPRPTPPFLAHLLQNIQSGFDSMHEVLQQVEVGLSLHQSCTFCFLNTWISGLALCMNFSPCPTDSNLKLTSLFHVFSFKNSATLLHPLQAERAEMRRLLDEQAERGT